jgi:hypothetical protein
LIQDVQDPDGIGRVIEGSGEVDYVNTEGALTEISRRLIRANDLISRKWQGGETEGRIT